MREKLVEEKGGGRSRKDRGDVEELRRVGGWRVRGGWEVGALSSDELAHLRPSVCLLRVGSGDCWSWWSVGGGGA